MLKRDGAGAVQSTCPNGGSGTPEKHILLKTWLCPDPAEEPERGMPASFPLLLELRKYQRISALEGAKDSTFLCFWRFLKEIIVKSWSKIPELLCMIYSDKTGF